MEAQKPIVKRGTVIGENPEVSIVDIKNDHVEVSVQFGGRQKWTFKDVEKKIGM